MKAYIDTSPFIYLIESHPVYADRVRNFFFDALRDQTQLFTSSLTLMEFGVGPLKKMRPDLLDQLEDLLNILDVSIKNVDPEIAVSASRFRAKYGFLKGMDAIHLATSFENQCDCFFTQDKELMKIAEIQVILVENV